MDAQQRSHVSGSLLGFHLSLKHVLVAKRVRQAPPKAEVTRSNRVGCAINQLLMIVGYRAYRVRMENRGEDVLSG